MCEESDGWNTTVLSFEIPRPAWGVQALDAGLNLRQAVPFIPGVVVEVTDQVAVSSGAYAWDEVLNLCRQKHKKHMMPPGIWRN